MIDRGFGVNFEALTGHAPFPWQEALYERFVAGDIPRSCNLPTGLGKTSVMPIWLIALAKYPATTPRRLVYVVNRRTVVDQATREAELLRKRLLKPGDYGSHESALASLRDALPRSSATSDETPEPLAISTLRGQFADNREWSSDPSRPAILVGTVDMIGSRLLFSGYGIGFKTRPMHAGFLGQDALLVHDEAHLEPAFQDLLREIEKEQARCGDFRPFRVMELSATPREAGATPSNPRSTPTGSMELSATPREAGAFVLSDEDLAHPEIQKRVDAAKRVHLHENRDQKKLADEIASLALGFKDSQRAILVFAQGVDDVDKVVKKLPKDATEALTGTLRGLERDGLIKRPVFQRFLPESLRERDVIPAPGTVYLVCTSAGEVGINMTADHLVCDLTTWESMAQRFGRVNRFGIQPDTEIHIVHPHAFDGGHPAYQASREKTLDLLRRLNGDGSPSALGSLDQKDRKEAFAPTPTILPVSGILFDSWALTTIRGRLPGRPPVEPYLHGIRDWEPPETHVAWRDEVGRIHDELINLYAPKDLLEDYPLKPHETLRDITNRVYDRLKKLKAAPATPVWIVSDDDSVEVTTLEKLVEAGKESIERKTVLLPPSAGGLEGGMLSGESSVANDVADEWRDEKGRQRRLRVWDSPAVPPNMRRIRPAIDVRPDSEEAEEDATGERFWYWFEMIKAGDSEGSRSNTRPVLWKDHVGDVVAKATAIVNGLPLEDGLKTAILFAASFHDHGKRRKRFQTVLGNFQYPGRILAKSGRNGGRMDEPYRHEFGSLLDVLADPKPREEFDKLSDDMKELALHLIAAHHGHARPHFAEELAFDPEPPEGANAAETAMTVPQRFARLQRKYGRWGLAYLESLLRAADYAASAKPSKFEEEES